MKYFGSKSRIAKYIVPILQKEIDENQIATYLEPFCGGCNIVDKIKCERKIANDLNEYLIALFQHLQAGGGCPTRFRENCITKPEQLGVIKIIPNLSRGN